MFVERKLYKDSTAAIFSRHRSFIQLTLADDEVDLMHNFELWSVRVDPGFLQIVIPEVRNILIRFRNRWNIVISRTSGFVLLDLIIAILMASIKILYLAFRLFFVRRVSVKDLTRGVVFNASSIENLR